VLFAVLVIVVIFCLCWLIGMKIDTGIGKGEFHFNVQHGDSGR